MDDLTQRRLHFETKQLHIGQEVPDPATGARAVPIYQTAAYVFENTEDAQARFSLSASGNIYGRLTNPTQAVLESRMAALEGGVAALAVASGAAAVSYTLQNLAHAGDHVVAANNLYGGTYNLLAHTLAQYGISTTFVRHSDAGAFERAIRENTKAVFIETMGNPNSMLTDIEKVAQAAHRHGVPLVVDNTFATPYLVRPLEYGADLVVHSATKFIGGHGTALGGMIVDGGSFDWQASGRFSHISGPNPSYHGLCFTEAAGRAAFVTLVRVVLLRDMGAAISPFHAFLLLQGLETLSLRVQRHVENTKKVLEYLAVHPQVERVNHPFLDPEQKPLCRKYIPNGGGTIFTFEIKGGEEKARKFIDSLRLFSLLANVADAKSLVIHPATTTHAQLDKKTREEQNIRDNTVRVSIGIEHIDDILFDLEQAFKAIA